MIALRGQQLWMEDLAGQVLRAWLPEGNAIGHGAHVEVYCSPDGELEGWRDTASAGGVDQRGFDGHSGGERQLACSGGCGTVWTVTAAAGHDCLACGGQLAPA